MDEEINAGTELSTKKPKTDGFRETTRRLRKGKEGHLSHRASLDWRQDRERVCGGDVDADEIPGIEALKEVLHKSRTGAALLAACGPVLDIFYDQQTPQSQFYPMEGRGVIVLNPHHPKGELLGMFSRELRRAWQHRSGALVNPMSFEPDEAVLVNRALAADTFMVSIRIAWELKLVGEADAWDFISASPQAEVMQAFETLARKDFRSLNNGAAARAAYDKLFESRCTKMHDKRLIHQMLLDDAGYMKAQGKRPCADMGLFGKLGEMPHGSNYLMSGGKRPPTDACYSTVEDRSNANFLWFIKFERSFQERELQMLQESVRASAEIIDLAQWSLRMRKPAGPSP